MVSNQVLGARLAAGWLIAAITLGGCSHLRHTDATATTPAPAPVTQAAGEARAVPDEQDMTATEAAIAAAGAGAAPVAAPPVETGPALKPGAPKHYTVKRGDTLWGIATMYLRDPWLWPEVWIINPQIPNPHLIYPGDTLALAFGADGRPQVSLEQAGAVRLDPRTGPGTPRVPATGRRSREGRSYGRRPPAGASPPRSGRGRPAPSAPDTVRPRR